MILLRGFTVLILLFMVAPILAVFPLSISSGELLTLPTPGVSLRWFEDLFSSSRWLLATRNSVLIGVATMALATTLGTLAAIGLFLGQFRGKAAIVAILSVPMVTPVIVAAVAMYFAFSAVGLTSSAAGLIVAHTVLALPYVLVTVLATLQGFDRTLLRAAATLGAPPHIAFGRILLPAIAPGVVAGAIFAFAVSFDELVVALFLASPAQFTLPRQMYAGINEFQSPTITAAAVLLVLCSILMLALNELLQSRRAR